MKKFLCGALGLMLLTTCVGLPYRTVSASAEEDKTIKLLAIGNSFSEDALTYLREVSLAAGEDIAVHHLVIGGTSLQQHWTNAERNRSTYTFVKKHTESFTQSNKSMSYGLEYDAYDYVVFQQVSGYSGIAESYEPYLTDLIDYVRGYQPNAQFLFHQTWAYEKDSTHADFPKYGSNQQTMHEAILEAVEQASVAHGLDLIPCGEAVNKARENARFDIEQGGVSLCRDGYHMADSGRALLALVWNGVLTGKKAVDNPYTNSSVSADDMQLLKEAADYAVELYHGRRIEKVELEGGGRFDVLQNERLQAANARVKVTYLDGQTRDISLGQLAVDTSEVGEHTVVYRYWKDELSFVVNVVSREKVDELIDHIRSVVRFPNIEDIKSLLRDYEALSPIEQAGVTNYDDLVHLKEQYLTPQPADPDTPAPFPWQYFLLLIPVVGVVLLGVFLIRKKRKHNNKSEK